MAKLNQEGQTLLAKLEAAEASGRKLNQEGQRLLGRLRQAGGQTPVKASVVEKAKEFFVTRPARGAEVLREAGADVVSPTRADIMAQAEKTGRVPYGRIAGRVAAETAAEMVPLTPTDIALNMATMGVPKGQATKAAGALAKWMERNMPKVSQAMTGVKKKYFERIFRKPGAILPEGLGGPKPLEKAGQALGEAEEAAFAGRSNPSVQEINDPDLAVARKNAIDAAESLELAKEIAKTDPEAASAFLRDPDTGAKILKGRRGTQAQLDMPSARGSKKTLLSQQETNLNNALEEYFPSVRKASLDYSDAKTREQAMKILPVLRSGDPSIARIVLTAMGRVAGMPAGMSLPAIHGLATAFTKVSLNGLERLAQVPQFRVLALAAIAERRAKEEGNATNPR